VGFSVAGSYVLQKTRYEAADMALKTDMQIKAIKLPKGKAKTKFAAGDGLFLLVTQSGKYWKYAYTYNEKRKEASLGVYPKVSMKAAKAKLPEIKALLAEGIDPNQLKREKKMANRAAAQIQQQQEVQDSNTFERVARQWHALHESRWSDKHSTTILRRFELHVFPFIGSVPVADLKKTQVADVLTAIAERGTVEIAKRIAQITRQVLDYAADRGLIDAIPMGNTKNLIPTYGHFIAAFRRSVRDQDIVSTYDGTPSRIKELASQYHITKTRVRQILASGRKD